MFTDISERNERKTPKRPSKSSLPCFSKHRAPCWRHLNRPAALRTAELCPSSWRNRLAVFRKPTWRLAEELARRAATVVENARLYAELEARVRRRTQELEQSNRELEAFSYSVSHDLRGPLRAISGFAGLLHAQHFDELDGGSRRYLERIEAGTVRMSALIDDLLELGRVTRVELNREPVDLSALAESVVSRMREGSAMTRAVASIEPGLRVYGDVRLLEIVLENLLDNSSKFAAVREVPRIEFGACPDAGAGILCQGQWRRIRSTLCEQPVWRIPAVVLDDRFSRDRCRVGDGTAHRSAAWGQGLGVG